MSERNVFSNRWSSPVFWRPAKWHGDEVGEGSEKWRVKLRSSGGEADARAVVAELETLRWLQETRQSAFEGLVLSFMQQAPNWDASTKQELIDARILDTTGALKPEIQQLMQASLTKAADGWTLVSPFEPGDQKIVDAVERLRDKRLTKLAHKISGRNDPGQNR